MLSVGEGFGDDGAATARDNGRDDGEQPDSGHGAELGFVEVDSGKGQLGERLRGGRQELWTELDPQSAVFAHFCFLLKAGGQRSAQTYDDFFPCNWGTLHDKRQVKACCKRKKNINPPQAPGLFTLAISALAALHICKV